MALTIEFSRRSTNQLQKILTFYDERNGSDTYSRQLLRRLLEDLQRLAQNTCSQQPFNTTWCQILLSDGVHRHLSLQHEKADGAEHTLVGSQAVEGLSEEMKDELKECHHGEIDNLTINK